MGISLCVCVHRLFSSLDTDDFLKSDADSALDIWRVQTNSRVSIDDSNHIIQSTKE